MQLEYYGFSNFLTKLSENLKFELRSGFRYMTQYTWQTVSYYNVSDVKREGTKEISNWKRKIIKIQR